MVDYTIAQAQFGVRIPVTKHSGAFLEHVGEEGIRQMISNHYDRLVKSEIKELFPADGEALVAAKQHSADFIIQISGGPAYFNQNRGAPQMVGRHAPFRIDAKARMIWLDSYIEEIKALKTKDGEDLPDNIKQEFFNYINVFSSWMVNTPS
jgi:hemoglobin